MKTIGLLLSIIGAAGIFVVTSFISIFPACCEVGMEFYYDVLNILTPVFILILIIGIYLFFKPEKKIKVIKTRLTKILTQDEKKVISSLKKGERTQAELRKELEFSKAKLSMLLEKMKKRGLLRKIKRGRTNIVVLKKF